MPENTLRIANVRKELALRDVHNIPREVERVKPVAVEISATIPRIDRATRIGCVCWSRKVCHDTVVDDIARTPVLIEVA